jgi:putative ABC transport system ATP-binding protein
MKLLEAKDLSKLYSLGEHAVEALKGVDFSVRKGEFVAIMGPSGSGKSTLMHLLGGLDTPTDGDIYLSDQALSKLNKKQITLSRRKNVGFVFQFFNLMPTLSAEENIMLPILIDGKNPKKHQDRLDQLLELIGLSDRRDHRPDQLSGGEQQRVAVGRALISNPVILLADEPTGNLDSKTGQEIMQLLRRSCEEFNQTVVVVSHDPGAAAYADRVVFLKDGKIIKEITFASESDSTEKLDVLLGEMRILGF